MSANYNPNLIRVKRSYSPSEIASLFGINRKTCSRWIKNEGLKVIEKNTNPLLIMGQDLKNFITKKRLKRKTKLKSDEYFCVKCNNARKAKSGSEKIVKTGKTIGLKKKEQEKKTGICESCGTKLNRFLGVYQRD